jgi:hypothetical protein
MVGEYAEFKKIIRYGLLIGGGKMLLAGAVACGVTWLLSAPPIAAALIGLAACGIADSITFEIDGKRY